LGGGSDDIDRQGRVCVTDHGAFVLFNVGASGMRAGCAVGACGGAAGGEGVRSARGVWGSGSQLARPPPPPPALPPQVYVPNKNSEGPERDFKLKFLTALREAMDEVGALPPPHPPPHPTPPGLPPTCLHALLQKLQHYASPPSDRLQHAAKGRQVVAVGDFNIAAQQADAHWPLEDCYSREELVVLRGMMGEAGAGGRGGGGLGAGAGGAAGGEE
jgi:hypothetical protein